MRKIKTALITRAVSTIYVNAAHNLPEEILSALKNSLKNERTLAGKDVLKTLIKNADIAKSENIPICQDTGLAVIFAEIWQEVQIIGGDFEDAVNEGVRKAVKEGYLRASVVKSPIDRVNTSDNTPAIIHTQIVPGNKIKLTVLAKGAGSENMSALKMLKPSDGEDGIIDFVIQTIKQAGPSACPPFVVGIGLGGNFEKAPYLAKKALLRPLDSRRSDKKIAKLEKELYKKINSSGIGPSGFGGKVTCLAVNIEFYPCHIASLPVAVNIECHAHRHKTIII